MSAGSILGRWRPGRVGRRLLGRAGGYQAGDGREEALATRVISTTPRGDIDAVIDAIDTFAVTTAFLINVGDEKGKILDSVVHTTEPQRILELGTYCGYSALRIARAMPPGARLYSVEPSRSNAQVARRIWQHAGVEDRVTCVIGALGDGGATLTRLAATPGLNPMGFDLVFLDHDKDAYLPDLRRLVSHRWIQPGSIVVADNVLNPGAPDYLAHMRHHEGTLWQTTEHSTHLEYQPTTPDLVLTSRYLPPA